MRRLAGLFVALVARHAARHRARTALTVASVAIGVAVVVAVSIANENAIASFRGSADYVSGGATIEAQTNGAGFPDAAVARAAAVPGVALAMPIVDGSIAGPDGRAAYDLVGLDLVAALSNARASSGTSPQLAMSWLSPHVFERGSIIVSSSLAGVLRAQRGQTLLMLAGARRVRLLVAGIIDDASMPVGARGVIFCDVSTAQEVLGRVGRIDRVDIVPAPSGDRAALASRLARALPRGTRIAGPDEGARSVEKMTEAFRFNLAALAVIALLVAAYLVFNAVSMSVVQRRAEIGIVRAVGAPRGSIFAVFLLEGVVVGVLGSVFGIALGLALAGVMLHVVVGTIDQLYAGATPLGWTAPASVYALAAALGIGTALAAAILPAREAASVSPSTAMRAGLWERGPSASMAPLAAGGVALFALAIVLAQLPALSGRPVFGYAAALAVIAGCSLLSPPVVALAARAARAMLPTFAGPPLRLAPANLRGRVRRNAVAVASLMIGVAMTVSVSTMIASFRSSVQTWIGATLRGDFFVTPQAAVNASDVVMPDSTAAVARGLSGVAAVDVVRTKLIDYSGRPAFAGASDMRVTGRFGYLPLLGGGSWRSVAAALVGADAALVSEPFARKFGISPGATVVVDGVGGPHRLRVAGEYEDYSSDTGFIFMDIATYRRIFGDDGINGFAVYLAPGADADGVRAALRARLGSSTAVTIESNRELRGEALAQFDRTFAVTSVLDAVAVAVALMGVVATLAALVLERTRELGVLRCLGMRRGQVRAMIVIEATLLGIMGAALGVAAGYALAGILVYVINPQAFGWTIGFAPTPRYDIVLFVVVTVTAALAGLIPAAGAAQLDVASALRAE